MMSTSPISRPGPPDPGGSHELPFRPLSGAIGAQVDGADLAAAGREGRTQLRSLVTHHHVVFITGFGLDEDTFVELSEEFGPRSVHPLDELLGRSRTVSVITDTADHPPAAFPLHTDLSWMTCPPRFGFLQALDIPPSGGDTIWVSLQAAFKALSPPFRSFLARLDGRHAIDATLRCTVEANHGAATAFRLEAGHTPVDHPLVRAHPDTGQPLLYLCPMYLDRIPGLTAEESDLFLGYLNRIVNDPNIAIRWRWSTGDVAIWDESSTLHQALADHAGQLRRMRRYTTAGGRPRRAIEGVEAA